MLPVAVISDPHVSVVQYLVGAFVGAIEGEVDTEGAADGVRPKSCYNNPMQKHI